MEKIIVVKSAEEKTAKNGNQYLQVTDKDDKKYPIFNSGIWNLFQVGFAVKLIGDTTDKGFNITGAEAIKDAEVIKAAKEAPTEMAPQELGMWWKELGECLRTGFITSDVLRKFYLAKMYSVIGFSPGKPKEEPKELEPEEIPF